MNPHSQLPDDLKRYSAEAHVKQQPELRERGDPSLWTLAFYGAFFLAAYSFAAEDSYQLAKEKERISAIPVLDRAKPGCTQYVAQRTFSTEPWLVREVPCGRVRK